MAKLSEYVGSKIRIFRKRRGFTQAQLSEIVQQPQSYLSDIERGEKNISLDTLERILEALKILPGDLFKSYEEKRSNEQMKTDSRIDYLIQILQDRKSNEIITIIRLVEDVLKAYDAK